MDAHFESEVVLLADEELDAAAGGKPSQARPVHADLSVVKRLDSASLNLCEEASFGPSGDRDGYPSLFSFRIPYGLSLCDGSNNLLDLAVQHPHSSDPRKHCRAAERRDQDQGFRRRQNSRNQFSSSAF